MRTQERGVEFFENTVATLVDMTSILIAYQIGVSKFGLTVGIGYGFFDAFMVVWMRKPITHFVRRINPFRRPAGIRKEEVQSSEGVG